MRHFTRFSQRRYGWGDALATKEEELRLARAALSAKEEEMCQALAAKDGEMEEALAKKEGEMQAALEDGFARADFSYIS